MRFAELKAGFWNPEAQQEVFAPLSSHDVARAEAVLGVRLPGEYVELLEIQNGGYVSHEFDAFPTATPTSWADDHVLFHTLAGIGPTEAWPSVTMSVAAAPEWGLPEGLVLLSGDGHYWIALDYRRGPTSEPSVTWLDTEVDQDITLARDFRTFLEGLVPMDRFADDVDLDLPRLHVARRDSDSTYCGYALSGDLTWVAENVFDPSAAHACPDCIRLIGEWQAALQRH